MLVAATLAIAGTACLIWLVFTFAVYALPFWAGLGAAMFAHGHGAGPIGGIVVGLFVAGLTLGLGQVLFSVARSPWSRALIGAMYAVPAGLAAYHAVHGLVAIGGTSEVWHIVFANVGAFASAGVAWARVSVHRPAGCMHGTSLATHPHRTALGTAHDS
ncbi:MAG TPA: hypothetical protein VGN97_03305 [Mesorhizobium sp.]|jgi:hypothetical protein|nr:hypothetical protein [Mesorhizobium sp.]